MVNFLSMLATTTGLAALVVAVPTNNTGVFSFPSPKSDLEARYSSVSINCRRLCRSPKWEEGKACNAVCQGSTNDKSEHLNKKQRKNLALTLFPWDADHINTLSKHSIKDYLFEHLDRSLFADSKRRRHQPSDLVDEQPAAAVNTTLHHLQVRKSTKVNCKYLCDRDASVFNQCACDAVCKHNRDKQDCKEKIHRMSKLRTLTACFFPGEAERKFVECKHATQRHKCFQRMFDSQWPDMEHFPGSSDC
ncbi:hypothetical protein PMIN04_001427 [Paraphaeosphaeria minitans]